MNRRYLLMSVLLFPLILFACQANEPKIEEEGREASANLHAEEELTIPVELINTEGAIVGSAVLSEEADGVLIALDATHLPAGSHGFHIHEKGSCELSDFESAGGHFNPTNKEHGFDNPEGPHSGDLPNIEVSQDGTVKAEVVANLVTLEGDKANSLFQEGGTSLVIHADPDDYVSQPAGDSGERIACGVISE